MSIFYIENSSINNYLSESGGVRKKIAQNYMTTAKNTGNGAYMGKAMNIAQPADAEEKVTFQVDRNNRNNVKEVNMLIQYILKKKSHMNYLTRHQILNLSLQKSKKLLLMKVEEENKK